MNPDIKKLWVDALRSGKYKQGRHALRSSADNFCCLGVLCDIYGAEKGVEWKREVCPVDGPECYTMLRRDGLLPFDVYEWAGLGEANPLLGDKEATSLNDTGHQIADLIEKHL